MRNFDYAKYSTHLETMDGDFMLNLEYHLVSQMEEATKEEREHLVNIVSLIQNELDRRES